MLIVLSPAKALDVTTPAPCAGTASPALLEDAAQLAAQLQTYSPAQLAELMGLSDKLAQLNFIRWAQWKPPFGASNAKPAIFTFNGDVYTSECRHGFKIVFCFVHLISGIEFL